MASRKRLPNESFEQYRKALKEAARDEARAKGRHRFLYLSSKVTPGEGGVASAVSTGAAVKVIDTKKNSYSYLSVDAAVKLMKKNPNVKRAA